MEAHNSGTKHKLMLEGQSVLPRRRGKVLSTRAGCKNKRLGTKGSVGVPSKNYQCEVCEISVNSETQLSQHMNSRRHKDRLAGKPPKPKFTPHSKTQPSSSLASVRWSGYAGVAGVCHEESLQSVHPQLALLTDQAGVAEAVDQEPEHVRFPVQPAVPAPGSVHRGNHKPPGPASPDGHRGLHPDPLPQPRPLQTCPRTSAHHPHPHHLLPVLRSSTGFHWRGEAQGEGVGTGERSKVTQSEKTTHRTHS
ncbi:hypothetical protein WMY93_003446 [Mugilogobius chulae]|uniref:C2H2-type domain-containing protein n=1 Tax=Mugilogobius chulae TaxID=88201 RepID=A0AAW0PXH0_9GOBI